jgi:diguanylate cyclase (GGDEF)-like protein
MAKIRFNRSTDSSLWGIVLFLKHQLVVNWTLLDKSILVLILAVIINLFWISWDILVLMTPKFYPWVNLNIVRTQLWTSIFMLVIFIALILPCHLFKAKAWVQSILPMLCVQLFTAMLCYSSYLIGSFSPTTMVGYVGIVGVGLILFDRKIIYCALIPATIALLLFNYLSTFAGFPYAPLFNMELMNQTVMHPFWVSSMLFFLVPLMLVCLFLFEILLSQWRMREATIEKLSRLDPLTNVMNRRSISSHLEKLHQNPDFLYSIVLLDLDYFKNINDQFGHHMGDQVLIKVAQCLVHNVRDQDIIGRFGGEEFILLFPNTSTVKALNIAERCRIAIAEMRFFTATDQPFSVSASFGISSSDHANEPHVVISQADQALYAVKAAGRNQVKVFSDLGFNQF